MCSLNDTYNECSICLSSLNNIVKPYICGHEFHSECISQWNGSCPICRGLKIINDINNINDEYPLNQDDQKCLINITRMENIYTKISNIDHINIYKNVWKIRSCVNENHNLIFIVPYGAMGLCKTCNRVESFNLMH